MKAHRKIVDEIINEYKNKRGILAITLFGSLARGEERKSSDVDIEIISESADKWELKQDDERYGINIDLVICPKKHLIYQLKKYPYLCYDYLSEEILYDPKGFMRNLRKKLKTYFDNHPEIVKFWEDKLKIMKEERARGKVHKNAIKDYDEAEILFSKEHKVTRNFFRE